MKIFKRIILLLLPFVLWACANQLNPGGGEVDKIPPEVLDVYPEQNQLNFNDTEIAITFSEYINKSSYSEAVFISPSIDGEVKYSWGGTTLYIEFEDSLRKNTTYTVTIGTEIKDYNNSNNMTKPYTLVFSTGNKIDHGQIYGRVFDPRYKGVLVFAYKEGDSLYNPNKTKPDFISQVGENGVYGLQGLSPGKYKVIAIKDALKNFLYDLGDDLFGVPYQEVVLTEKDSVVNNINFQLAIEDTIAPGIVQVTMTDQHHYLLEFSEFVDSSKINNECFFIYDSTDKKKINVDYVFKGKAKKKQLFIASRDTLIEGNENYLNVFNIPDNHGNLSQLQEIELAVNTKPDTLLAKVSSVKTKFKGNEVDYINPSLEVIIDDGIEVDSLINGVRIFDKNELPISFDLIPIDDASFVLNLSNLKPKSDYVLKFDLNYLIDAAGNKLDSTYTYKFKTVNDLYFSGAIGNVEILENTSTSDYRVVIENVEERINKYQAKLKEDNSFEFARVIPGLYQIWFYQDLDSSNTYTKGKIYPLEFSEPFRVYPDTLNLRARWPVGDIILK